MTQYLYLWRSKRIRTKLLRYELEYAPKIKLNTNSSIKVYKFLRFVAYSGMFRADHDCGSIIDSVVLCPQILELINFYIPTRSFRFTRSFFPIPLSMLTREFGPSESYTTIQRALTAPVLISSTLASIA